MILASYNVNGIRAAMKKGFLQWVDGSGADVLCLQEIRARVEQIDTDSISAAGWNFAFFPAEKLGYAGTGILSRTPIGDVRLGTGDAESDREGRVISAVVDRLRIYSVYAPSGSSGSPRQSFKMEWLAAFREFTRNQLGSPASLPSVFCGDFNICRSEMDIHDPKGLSGTSGFLPEERLWFSEWLSEGLSDSFRDMNPDLVQYSWWSLRSAARKRNLGWRIDYIATCAQASRLLKRAWIDSSPGCSDHCPTLVDLDV